MGNIFLCAIAVAVSVIASRTGLTFALLTRYSFGSSGSRVASLFVPIVNVGWYTIQSASYGHFVASVFGFGDVGEAICMVLSAALMGIFAFYGVKAITILGYIAIPAIIFLTLATTIRSMGVMGSVEALFQYRPSAPISMAAGITVVIGAWILSTATCLSDIMRYAKSTKSAVAAALTGLLGGNILMLICGAIATIAMDEYDLTVILLGFGLVIPSLILMTTNIFTTNAANLYSTGLNLANSFKIGRTKMMIILIAVSAAATLLKPHEADFYYTFLNALGNVIPAGRHHLGGLLHREQGQICGPGQEQIHRLEPHPLDQLGYQRGHRVRPGELRSRGDRERPRPLHRHRAGRRVPLRADESDQDPSEPCANGGGLKCLKRRILPATSLRP